MLCGAPKLLLKPLLAANCWQFVIQRRIPHWQAAVVTPPSLRMHLGLADIFDFSHNTGSPFNFVRSECAASETDAPRREAYARARPDFSWFRNPDNDISRF